MEELKIIKKFKAVQTGGPSGGCLTEKDLDTPIDFDTLSKKRFYHGFWRNGSNGRR